MRASPDRRPWCPVWTTSSRLGRGSRNLRVRLNAGAQPGVLRAPVATSLATTALSDASDASRNPDRMDVLDAGGRIYAGCTTLRALWPSRPVLVRVHSSALERTLPMRHERAAFSGAFLHPNASHRR